MIRCSQMVPSPDQDGFKLKAYTLVDSIFPKELRKRIAAAGML